MNGKNYQKNMNEKPIENENKKQQQDPGIGRKLFGWFGLIVALVGMLLIRDSSPDTKIIGVVLFAVGLTVSAIARKSTKKPSEENSFETYEEEAESADQTKSKTGGLTESFPSKPELEQ